MDFKIHVSTVIGVGFTLLLFLGCSENLFDRAADKDTQEAILFEANQRLNKRDYDGAIALFSSLDSATLADREVVVLFASAYSGRCGLEFISLIENLGDASASSVFGLLMGGFPGADLTSVADCDEAETRLKAIGNEGQRNIDENLLTAFNAFAEIGTILSAVADQNDDGNVDGGFEVCNTSNTPNGSGEYGLTDEQVDAVGAAMALSIKSLAGIGGDFADVDAITDACTNSSYPPLADICAKDNGGFSANEIKFLRGFIGSSDLGIGACGRLGDLSCFCP